MAGSPEAFNNFLNISRNTFIIRLTNKVVVEWWQICDAHEMGY